MPRYVMANRRSGKFHETEKRASRDALAGALGSLAMGISLLHDTQPVDPGARRVVVFDADPSEVSAKADHFGADVILEREILHYTEDTRPMDFLTADAVTLSGPLGSGESLTFTIHGGGAPLAGAEVVLFLRGMAGARQANAVTDRQGRVVFRFDPFWSPSAVVAVPAGDFWTVVVRGPSSGQTIDCPPLPQDGPRGWWHRVLGVSKYVKSRGKGIRVGVADTGVGPHPCLAHVNDLGAFVDGDALPGEGADVEAHGTHVCGIIGARPTAPGQYAGLVPGVILSSARVFPKGRGANQGDIASAIDALSKGGRVDLINLSLGSPSPSEIARDAILDAVERGTLCVCAAANSAGPVEFPAAFPETAAVSALGLLGWGPTGTLAAVRVPEAQEKFGLDQLYLANFSSFGPAITCCGPGVGIISTVPERLGLSAPYAAMGGTSMASPAACGALAAVLSRSKRYLGMARDRARAEEARRQLREVCRDVGLIADFQGRGLPQA